MTEKPYESHSDEDAELKEQSERVLQVVDEELSWFQSVRKVLSNRNWAVYLGTVWIYNSIAVINQYFTLYFRDIGISYILVGVLISVMFIVNAIGTFVAGYLADNYDRRKLSVLTMVVNGIGFILLALVRDVFLVTIAMIVIGLSAFTGVAGIAYQMSQVERKYAGVANSLFTLGTALGLVPLFIITVLLDLGNSFVDIIQWLLLAGGGLYLIAALIRATVLESIPNPTRVRQDTDVLRDFIGENIRGLKLLFKVLPIFVAVICIDAFSDAFYRFANLYYVNETLNFGMNEINLMFLITLIFSVPLTLYIGRVFDKRGGRKLTIVVYAIMPIAVGLLIIAQYVPYVAPQGWLDVLDSLFPGLSVILSLAFIATAIKQTNDILWYSILGTYIQKSMPRQDLGKMMSLNNVVVMVFISFGPIPAGFIYDMWQGLPLLYIVLILNILILIVLSAKSIEPTIDVDELEKNDELRLE